MPEIESKQSSTPTPSGSELAIAPAGATAENAAVQAGDAVLADPSPDAALPSYPAAMQATVLLAHEHAHEAKKLRRHCWMSWSMAAIITVLGLTAALNYSLSAYRATAYARAQAELTDITRHRARQVSDRLLLLEREHAVAQARVEDLSHQLEQVQRKAAELNDRAAQLAAEKRQAEAALQAALASMFEQQTRVRR